MTDENENPENDESTPDAEILDVLEDEGNDGVEPPIFDRRDGTDGNSLKRAIFNVPIEVVVSVGTARPLIGDLLTMSRNHLLPLDSAIDDPVELRVKDRVIARGELAQMSEAESQLGIRLTEIVNISDLCE